MEVLVDVAEVVVLMSVVELSVVVKSTELPKYFSDVLDWISICELKL